MTAWRALVLVLVTTSAGAAPPGPPPGLPPGPPRGAQPDDATVRKVLGDELARSLRDLHIGDEPKPYFIAYTLADTRSASVSATFGAATGAWRWQGRRLRVDLRVGDPSFDNGNFEGGTQARSVQLAIEDDEAALRRELWWNTDAAYKKAVETLARKRAAVQGKARADDDDVADFAPAPRIEVVAPVVAGDPDPAVLRPLCERLSAVFRDSPDVSASRVSASWAVTRRRFLSSEGTWVDDGRAAVTLTIQAEGQADDGMPVRTWASHTAQSPEGLPPLAALEKDARRLAAEVAAVRRAKIADNGSAYVLFEGAAAPQLVRLLAAEALAGTPGSKGGDDGWSERSPWSSKLGQRVAAPILSVIDDPGASAAPGGAGPLWGGYRVDEEGVVGERVTLIERGILRSLLMTRAPRKEIARSNGHARGNFGALRPGPSNLLVSAGGGQDRQALRLALARKAKADGVGLLVVRLLDDGSVPAIHADETSLQVGMMSGRGGPPSVRPLLVHRITVDARNAVHEEPLRGVLLEGLLPRSLKDVVAAGRETTVVHFTDPPGGIGVLSSVVAPALAIDDVDIKRDVGSRQKPPPYPHPSFAPAR